MSKIRHNHPDLKGHFTCLGCHFNVLHKQSMVDCEAMLATTTPADRRDGEKEIATAKKMVKLWQPDPSLEWLYKVYAEENADDNNS